MGAGKGQDIRALKSWQAPKVCMSDGSLEALPRKMASLENTLQQTPGISVWLHGKPAFLSSAAPNPLVHQHIPSSPPAASAPALGVLTQGPGAHSQCEPSWFGVKEHTEALWVGAAFPMDDLQLLPASSSPRWIILLCQVCNYSLCHLPGWAMGAGGRMFVLNLTSWVLGAAGRAMEMQWGKRW